MLAEPAAGAAALARPALGNVVLGPPRPADEADELEPLRGALPHSVQECTAERAARVEAAAKALDEWANQLFWDESPESASETLELASRFVAIKSGVDHDLEVLLELRTEFAAHADEDGIRDRMRTYLTITSEMVDLSGRLRYLLRDVTLEAAYANETSPTGMTELLELLTGQRVGIGALIMAEWLFDPPSESGLEPLSLETKARILNLIASCRQVDALPDVAAFAMDIESPPVLVLEAAEVIRQLGLPQSPGPGQDPTLPTPVVTAEQLREVLMSLDDSQFSREENSRLEELIKWLTVRRIEGIVGPEYHYGSMEIRPGDWLLMRNPSPYNLFTDLSPGLFTHVGVVAAVTGEDGVRRFVVIDLPERGATMPSTNVDIFLKRTLNYVFVRHPLPEAGERMGQAAASTIGNETQFDLNFRGDRVEALRGQPLEGQLIYTYCAGLLLLCAQETGVPREDFFPFDEYPAEGQTAENLATLGLSIGDRFVSPTGALFSSELQIVGRRESMYEPGREIKEAIYDHFASRIRHTELTPNPDAYQALRQKLAEVSRTNPWLARALARASDVNEKMDLESAAKTAAVVETLDEIAESNANDFFAARQAIVSAPMEEPEELGDRDEEIAKAREYRELHGELLEAWERGEISPRELRTTLVEHYARIGSQQLDARFFTAEQNSNREHSEEN